MSALRANSARGEVKHRLRLTGTGPTGPALAVQVGLPLASTDAKYRPRRAFAQWFQRRPPPFLKHILTINVCPADVANVVDHIRPTMGVAGKGQPSNRHVVPALAGSCVNKPGWQTTSAMLPKADHTLQAKSSSPLPHGP